MAGVAVAATPIPVRSWPPMGDGRVRAMPCRIRTPRAIPGMGENLSLAEPFPPSSLDKIFFCVILYV